MKRIVQFYRVLNLLSLDIAVGALAGVLFFGKIFHVHIRIYGLISLALTVWIIYTADHLQDVRKLNKGASTPRHQFHQKNFRVLSFALILAFMADAVLIFFIRRPVFFGGLALAAVVIVYFLIQKSLYLSKEFFGALLYSGGVWLAPLSLTQQTLSLPIGLLMLQFFLAALINLLLFSWFDLEHDEKDEHRSFTRIAGGDATISILHFLFGLIATTSLYLFVQNPEFMGAILIIVLMNAILFFILAFRKYFAVGDRYRLLGDAVFFLPILYWLT